MSLQKVSVIVPLYNKEATIRYTANSVLAQNSKEIELLIVDDGSTDRSLAQLEDINDSRLRIIRTPNRGVSSARNLGIQSAAGEFIYFLDADDLLEENAFRNLQLMVGEFPQSDLWVANFFVAPLVGEKYLHCSLTESGSLDQPLKLYWEKRLFLRMGNFLVRKSVLIKEGGFNSALKIYEDSELAFRLLRRGRVSYFNLPLMTYCLKTAKESVKLRPLAESWAGVIDLKLAQTRYEKLILADHLVIMGYSYVKSKNFRDAGSILWRNLSNLHWLFAAVLFRLKNRLLK